MRIKAFPMLLLLSIVTLVVTCSAPSQLDSSRTPADALTSSPSEPSTPSPTSAPATQGPTETPVPQPTETSPPTLTPTEAPEEASIEIIEPNGGEAWLEGSTHPIIWRSSGVDRVDVEAASGGKAWVVALGVDADSEGLAWEIPVGLISNFGVARSDAMGVRVYSSDNPELYDENDKPFTVRTPRIQFEPGTEAGIVTGTLQSKNGQYRYVLQASAGQTMEIEVSPPQVKVDIWGAEEGSTWEIPIGEQWVGIPTLPATQDYFVTLTNPSPDDGVDYVMETVIR